VFLKERYFRVRHGKGGVWHEANFDDETCKWLHEHMASLPYHSSLDYLFQNEDYTMPLNSATLYKMLRRKAEKVGIHACAQKFRRSLGGEMISNGADLTMVKDQLGHKSIQTTARYYVHFSTKRKKENYKKYVPAFGTNLQESLSG
jgi:integrase